jgi:hypothetical protein
MIQVSVGNGTVSVESDGPERDELGGYRQRYTYTIAANGWEYVGNDIYSGVGAEIDERDALGTLLSFLGACGESRQYRDRNGYGGENVDLFPEYVGQWCEDYSDDIGMLAYELEQDPDDIAQAHDGCDW